MQDALLDLSRLQFRVAAHLVAPRESNGHLYCELVETDASGRRVAAMRAVVWQSRLAGIRERLKAAGVEKPLAGNTQVCALCSVRFHPVFGLSLEIQDVDPHFGEAGIDRNRRLILERLKADGTLRLQERLAAPVPALRVGLVTAPGSAAYNDFVRTLDASPYAFRVLFHPVTVQGERTAPECIRALQALAAERPDVICLIRGGGSPLDLAWFDDETLARAIAACPVPVWTGIGHEIDRTVPDFVAHTAHKTPTAAAEALVAMAAELDARLAVARGRLRAAADRALKLARQDLGRNLRGARTGFAKLLALSQERFGRASARAKGGFGAAIERRLSGALRLRERLRERFAARLETLGRGTGVSAARLRRAAPQRLSAARDRLHAARARFAPARFEAVVAACRASLARLSAHLEAVRPENLMRRGWTLTTDASGNAVRSVASLAPGATIVTRFADGTAVSTVKQTLKSPLAQGRGLKQEEQSG